METSGLHCAFSPFFNKFVTFAISSWTSSPSYATGHYKVSFRNRYTGICQDVLMVSSYISIQLRCIWIFRITFQNLLWDSCMYNFLRFQSQIIQTPFDYHALYFRSCGAAAEHQKQSFVKNLSADPGHLFHMHYPEHSLSVLSVQLVCCLFL